MRRSYQKIGCDPGSGWFPSPTSGVRLLGGLPAWQAVHLVVGPVSYAGRAGFDPLACHDDPSGDSSGGCAAARVGTWRAGHLGVIAVLHTAGAGFDSLARYPAPSWCAQCDGRTRVCESRSEGSIPSVHPALTGASEARPLVPKSSGEDARLSTAIGEFDPRRDRSRGGMCQGGELHLQCGCGRFDSGPLHDLQHRRHGDRGAARSPGMREGSVRPRVTARRRCSGVVQWQGAGLWHQLSRFESSHLNYAPVAKWQGTRLQSAERGFDSRPVLDLPHPLLAALQ